MHLLDIGCGIGGPSRFFAAEGGCRVTGIDLTEDYVRTAEALARRVGLDRRVSYRQASALDLPFEAGTFDGAYMMHVGMNIEDKPRLFAEVRRVLKQAACSRSSTSCGPATVRWAFPCTGRRAPRRASSQARRPIARRWRRPGSRSSRSATAARSRATFFRQVTARIAEAGGPPPLGIHILMKRDVPEKLANVMSNVENGLIAPIEIVCRHAELSPAPSLSDIFAAAGVHPKAVMHRLAWPRRAVNSRLTSSAGIDAGSSRDRGRRRQLVPAGSIFLLIYQFNFEPSGIILLGLGALSLIGHE